MILLLSLRHTGTHFVKAFLEQYASESMPLGNVDVSPVPDDALVWGHYDHAHLRAVESLGVQPIVPMRDPLAVCISHWIRGESWPRDLWLHAAKHMDEFNPVYWPVDLPQDRFDKVLKLCMTKRDHHLKHAYRKRDVEWIRSAMPEMWNQLKMSQALKPWLERMGYENYDWLW